MYKFKVDISENEYDHFVSQHSLISIMQERGWAHVKNNWEHVLVGLYQGDELVAAAMLLIKKLALNINLIYIPRGFVIDYCNRELVKEFTKNLEIYAKQRKAYCIKIDPFFCVDEKSVKDNVEIPLNFKKDSNLKHQNLMNNGYHHKGFKLAIASYLQPRFHMAVPMIDKDNNFLDEDTLRGRISKTTRNYIGNYHQKRGVYFTYSSDCNNLDTFYGIINITEKRQGITLRDKDYFKRILEAYKDKATMCFAHVNLNKYIAFLENELQDSKNNIDDTKRQLAEAVKVKEENGNDVITSVALIVTPSNEKGLRMMEYLYAGNNTDIFSHLNTNVGLLFDIFRKCLDEKIEYCNLGGVEGTLDDRLSTFKSKFNPIVLEFVGEYDLPINKNIYRMFDSGIPVAKTIYKKVRNIIKRVKQ